MPRFSAEDLVASSDLDPVAGGEEIRLLDGEGHVTPEAAAFTDELGVYQRAVVDRHVAACPACARQAADLARARQVLAESRPPLAIPAGLDLVGRQIAVRSLKLARREADPPAVPAPDAPALDPWWRPSPALTLAMLAGLGAALLVGLIGLLLGGCKSNKPEPGPRTVQVGAPKELARTPGKATAAHMSGAGILAVGLESGGVERIPTGGDTAKAPLSPSMTMDAPVAALVHAGERLLVAADKSVVLWDPVKGARLKDVTGPQQITALAVDGKGKVAFFGTDQGHVLSWDLARRGAEAVAGFPCGATGIAPARLQLPPSKRCKFGTYFQSPDGQHACLYPVSHLLVQGDRLLRACREGTLAARELSAGKNAGWFTAGHLAALAHLPPDRLLLARQEGQLNIYSPGDNKLIHALVAPAVPPLAAAASEHLLVVFQGAEARIWSRPGRKPAATV